MAASAEIVEDLEFRSTRRIRLFQEGSFKPTSSYFEWLICSSKYGIALALLPNNRLVSYQTSSIHALQKQSETDPEVVDLPSRTIDYFQPNVQIVFVRLSSNERTLAFGIDTPNGAFVHIFDIFALSFVTDIQASNGDGKITCLEWNPESEDLFTVGTTDGSLTTIKYSLDNRLNFSIVGQITMSNHPICLSWSRKGKQLSVGDSAGRLHQLKPELTSVRVVDPPQQIENLTLPVQCAGIFWVATTDWLIVYRQIDNPMKLSLSFLTVKKGQAPAWTFFGDLTFQRPNAPQQFDTSLHFVPLMNWNMLFIFAHRSPDFAVVGQRNNNWITFVMDKYNIMMPIGTSKTDTYPIGAAFDFTSTANVPLNWDSGDSSMLPPQPMLHIISSAGLLLPYHICSLDQQRPNFIIKPISFSAQNLMNGPQPDDFRPRQEIVQQPASIQPKPSIPPQLKPTKTLSHENEQSSMPNESVKVENTNSLQTDFEKILSTYSVSKHQLIKELAALSEVRETFIGKSINFDSECVESLWGLFEKVHLSLNDGFQSVETTSQKCANLTGHLKQIRNVWRKNLPSSNGQRRHSIVPSNLLEDLQAADRRFQQIGEKFEKLEATAKPYLDKEKKDPLDLSSRRNKSMEMIPGAEQMRINKVNEAVTKRVAQYTKRIFTMQHHLRILKIYMENKKKDRFEDMNIKKPITSSTPTRSDTSVGNLTHDIQRLLLIIDGKTDFSPLANKFKSSQVEVKNHDGSLTPRQLALNNFIKARSGEATQIQRVCPRKLIVDETPILGTISMRNKAVSNELKDLRLQQEIATAKQSLMASKTTLVNVKIASPSVQLMFGTTVDSAAILNVAKSTTVNENQPLASVSQPRFEIAKPVEPVQSASDQSQKAPQESKVQASSFLFANMGKSTANEEKDKISKAASVTNQNGKIADTSSQLQPSVKLASFSFAPKEEVVTTQSESPEKSSLSSFSFASKIDDANNTQIKPITTTAPSNFSFVPQKDDSGLSSALNKMSTTNQPAEPSNSGKVAFSFMTPKPAVQQQSPTQPTNFSFTPKTEPQPTLTTEAASPFGKISTSQPSNQAQGGPVMFSFAPKTDSQQPQLNNVFGKNLLGSNSNQQSATGWSTFGTTTTTQKTAFGENSKSNIGSTFQNNGSGFSAFSQNNSNAFGQPSSQSSIFSANTQQQPSAFSFNNQQASSAFGSTSFTSTTQQSSSGFGSNSFGLGPSFGSGSAFGTKPAFGTAPGANTTGSGFGTGGFSSTPGGFSAFANKGSSFGQLAQQSQQQPSAFSSAQQSSPFGSGFGSATSSFGASSAFSDGNSTFTGNSAFKTSQQNSSPAFTAFRK